MKNKKLQIFPLQTTFLKKVRLGVQYSNENHYTNFDISSFEIKSFNDSPRDESWPTDSIFVKALKTLNIGNPRYLTRLKIIIQASFLFNTSTIRHLGLSLARHFKILNKLDLRFLSCRKLHGKNLRYLLDSFTKGMNNLAEVDLYFLGCNNIDDRCLEDLKASILKRCKKLQIFRVVVEGYVFNRWDKGHIYFEPNLDARLQDGNIMAGYDGMGERNMMTSEGGKSLCRGIARYLKKLRSLTFKISGSLQEDHMKLTKGIFRMMARLPNLKDLNFSFPEFFETDDEFPAEAISNIGKDMKNLQALSLDFPYTELMTERGFQQLAHNLFSSLSSQLTYFALHMEHCFSVTNSIVREIGSNIARNLKNLQTLILSLGNIHQLTEKVLSEFTHIISTGLPSLKKLILSFAWFKGGNGSFPLVLPKQIQQFDLYLYHPQLMMIHNTWENLNRISLSFYECQENTNYVDLFSEPSLTFKNLNELRLIYSQSHKAENKQIQSLATQIGTKLDNLTSLELEFPACPLLTSDSLLFLSDEICKKLKKLRHLNFTFTSSNRYCHSSLVEGRVLYLTSIIASSLEDLESLTLSFHGLMDEQTNMERMLNELCSLIPVGSLKKLRKLTLMFGLFEDLELKRKIREKLCYIPMLEIH